MRIELGDFNNPQVIALLKRHLEGMHEHTPAGHVCALDWSGLQQPEISFYTLWDGDQLLGCGALKELSPTSGELKSMRTADAPHARCSRAMILRACTSHSGSVTRR